VTDGKTNRAYAEEIVSLFKDCQKPDITIECSGAESSISTGIYATRSGTDKNKGGCDSNSIIEGQTIEGLKCKLVEYEMLHIFNFLPHFT